MLDWRNGVINLLSSNAASCISLPRLLLLMPKLGTASISILAPLGDLASASSSPSRLLRQPKISVTIDDELTATTTTSYSITTWVIWNLIYQPKSIIHCHIAGCSGLVITCLKSQDQIPLLAVVCLSEKKPLQYTALSIGCTVHNFIAVPRLTQPPWDNKVRISFQTELY